MIEVKYSSENTDLQPGDPVVYIGTSGKTLCKGVVIRRTPKGYTVGNTTESEYEYYGIPRTFSQVVPLK